VGFFFVPSSFFPYHLVVLTLDVTVPAWKARFGAECVSAVVQSVLTARAPKYSTILELDRKVRDMQLPHHTLKLSDKGLPFVQTMSNVMPNNYRLLSLWHLVSAVQTLSLM
jgi:hypothetical protein